MTVHSYVVDYCTQLDIPHLLIGGIAEDVVALLRHLRKRGKCRDGIIVYCIYHHYKHCDPEISLKSLSDRAGLEVRYVYKADTALKRLGVDQGDFDNSVGKVQLLLNREGIDCDVVRRINTLSKYYNNKDVLLDCTPQTVTLITLIQALRELDVMIDLSRYSEVMGISIATLHRASQAVRSLPKYDPRGTVNTRVCDLSPVEGINDTKMRVQHGC